MTGPDDSDLPRAPGEGAAAGLAFGEWPGGEPAIVLAHGVSSNHRAFLEIAPLLAPLHRVIALDLRGRGRSVRDGVFGIDSHGDDIVRVCDELGLVRPVLAGHSLGAFACLIAAVRMGPRIGGLALLDAGLVPAVPVPLAAIRALLPASTGRLGKPFESLAAYSAYWEQETGRPQTPNRVSQNARDLIGEPGSYVAATTAEAFDEDLRSVLSHPGGIALLAQVQAPLLLVRAAGGMGADGATTLVPRELCAAAQRLAPAMRVEELEAASHFDLLEGEHAAEVARLVRELAA